MSTSSPRLLAVVGPTASGKSDLALRLAREIGGEVVSADSVQVYRRFDLGSGKPNAEARALVPHHLIDVVDPCEAMDAARWVELAEQAIADILASGRCPILCGGTFLWVRALLYGLAPVPSGDVEIRARHQQLAAEHGRDFLHQELGRVDPESAQRLAPGDLVRVSRALEVYELTGRPLSSWHAEHGFRAERHPALLVGIRHLPQELDRRIEARTAAMLEAGWIEEVQGLLDAGFGAARPMKSIGYRQVAAACLSPESIDRAVLAAEVVRATRVFARRQRTWLRDRQVVWLTEAEAAALDAASLWERG
jgi:tRNA dimethylallyltransferase